MNHPSRIVEPDGDLRGILWFENSANAYGIDEPDVVDDIAEHPQPNELISSNTTVIDAVELFGARGNHYFYVIHRNDIVGVLFYRDLFKPLGRLAFLALALEIEDQAVRLCQASSINERCWLSLSANRKEKAVDLFRRRYKREPIMDEKGRSMTIMRGPNRIVSDLNTLIECTHLSDKATMIWKQKLISGATQADVLGFFNDLKEVRDQCAHPGSDDELVPKDQLAGFVHSARRMRHSLKQTSEIVLTNKWQTG
jgi:hypothetical protein